jgi:hypothetical protein
MRFGLALVTALAGLALVPAAPAASPTPIAVTDSKTTLDLSGERTVELPAGTTHVSLAWAGAHDAAVAIALSHDGRTFEAPLLVAHDESERDGADAASDLARSAPLWTAGARWARLTTDTPIATLTVTSLAAGVAQPSAGAAVAAVDQPEIISRAGWGADESLRFDADGNEIWPRTFYPVQKLIVHHTATRNADPTPAATVRAIYRDQAVNRGWGDIGYNLLIDEQGRVYEGRYSRDLAAGETPTGTDADGNGVVGAHVGGWNSGTMGIALLGTLTDQDATPAARSALEWLLAWLAERHGIDPDATSTYVNPVNGATKTNQNITGHRDWAATECPGGAFYATFPSLRHAVATRLGQSPPPPATAPAAPDLSAETASGAKGVRLAWTVPADGGSPITEYRVFREKSGSFVRVATVGASTTTWRDRNTKRGVTYTYVVRAVNAMGPGPFSNEASAVAR